MILLFDIGATKTRLAVAENGKISKERSRIILTPQNFEQGIKTLTATASELAHGSPFKKVFGGIAGRLNKDKSKILSARKLADWEGEPLKKKLEAIFKCKVVLENDAALGALGEAKFGAGRGANIVAFLTLSTGLGGARVVGGQIDANAIGFEPGKQIIQSGKKMVNIEDLISGKALSERFGKPAESITNKKVWAEVEKLLAVAINNTFVFWSPDVIVLGGSVMNSRHLSLERVKRELKKIIRLPFMPEIRKGQLGDYCGIYGGLALAKTMGIK